MNRSLVVASVVFTGFFICLTLPANSHIPGPLKHPLVAHLTFPVLILLLLRMNPLHNGLGIGNWRKGLWLSFLASIAVLSACFLLAKVPAMQFYYSAPKWGTGDAQGILLGEWGGYGSSSAGNSCFGAFCCSRCTKPSARSQT